jgi:hypothetical protein
MIKRIHIPSLLAWACFVGLALVLLGKHNWVGAMASFGLALLAAAYRASRTESETGGQ